MTCPQCGSKDCVAYSYDYGIDQETGYNDSGIWAQCNVCGCESDPDDFEDSVEEAMTLVHTGQAIGWYRCDGKNCPVCGLELPSKEHAIDALLDAIDDAADGQNAWLEYGPYQLILQRAKELRTIVPGLKESYEPNNEPSR